MEQIPDSFPQVCPYPGAFDGAHSGRNTPSLMPDLSQAIYECQMSHGVPPFVRCCEHDSGTLFALATGPRNSTASSLPSAG